MSEGNVQTTLATLNAERDSFVVIPSLEPEASLVREWLEAKAPKAVADGRVYEEFDLHALQKGTLIAFAFRDPRRPSEEVAKLDGERVQVPRARAELLAEVRLTEPLKVAAYWRQEPMRPGRVDVAALMEDAGKRLTPYRLAYSDASSPTPMSLRLRSL